MARKRRQNKGRPRKIGPRHPNGELVASEPKFSGPTIPAEAARRRAEAVGGVEGTESDPIAGHALGRMLYRGTITHLQYRAGTAYANLWRAYLGMRGIPSRGMICTDAAPPPVDEDLMSAEERDNLEKSRRRLAERFRDAEAVIVGCSCGAAVRNVLGNLLLREEAPETPTRIMLICRGLDAMVAHLKLRDDDERKKAA